MPSPAAPPLGSHSKGPRETHHPWLDPSEGPGGAEPACGCFKAGPWRRDQVSNGETGQVAIAQSSRGP